MNHPFGRFKFLLQDKIEGLGLNAIRKDNPEGCISEVDI